MADEDEDIFDVVVIGGGVAGCTAAYKLAQQGHSVVLIERAAQPGSKNLSGGVFYCRVMEQVFPGFVDNAPVERRITRNVVSFANPTSTVNIDYWDQRLAEPVNAVSVLRAKLDAWLSEQCEEAGVMVMPGVKVDELVIEGGQVVGVRAGEDELRARIVIAADGVNSFIAQQAGIRPKEPKKSLAVGVKWVIALDPATIEQRFHCSGDEGTAYAVVGDCTQGVAGGGFLYTNKESISIGVVLRLDDLVAKGLASSDVHDHFLAHPAIAPLLEGGQLREYGCHLTIEDGPAMVAHELHRAGLMIVGDAAGFTLNTGLTIRGMDLAAGSALAAASAAHRALTDKDYSDESMARYERNLERDFVGQDMRTYAHMPELLDSPRMYGAYGEMIADVMHGMFNMDTRPRTHAIKVATRAFKKSSVRLGELVRDGITALKAL